MTGTGAVKNDDGAVEEYKQKINSLATVLQVKGVQALPTKPLAPRNSAGGDQNTTPRASSSDEIVILDDATDENVRAAVKTKKKRKRKEDPVASASANLSHVLKKRDVQSDMMTMEAKMKFVRRSIKDAKEDENEEEVQKLKGELEELKKEFRKRFFDK